MYSQCDWSMKFLSVVSEGLHLNMDPVSYMKGQWWTTAASNMSITSNESNETETESSNVDNEEIVRCDPGYRPSSANITCITDCDGLMQRNETVQCTRQCVKPLASNLSITSNETEFYDLDDVVTVRCEPGYRPSSINITCIMDRSGLPQWNETVQCIRLCDRPEAENLNITREVKPYYDMGDVVVVSCDSGYRPSSDYIMCENYNGTLRWNGTARCLGQCVKPQASNLSITSNEAEFYDIDDVVTVRCEPGYRPSSTNITCIMDRSGLPQWNDTVHCIRLCDKPEVKNLNITGEVKSYYDMGDVVVVSCDPGYRPSSDYIMCENYNGTLRWNGTALCLAQCRKPDISNVYPLASFKDYYNVNESAVVTCRKGYFPNPRKITCVSSEDGDKWNRISQCIEVTMTDWKVTSTSISFQILCTEKCPSHWKFTACWELMLRNDTSCTDLDSNTSVTFTNLQPFSKYRINTTLHIKKSSFLLETMEIRTNESDLRSPTSPIHVRPLLSDLSYPCQTSALRPLLSVSDLRSPSFPIHVRPPLSELSYPCQTSALRALLSMSDLRSPSSPIHVKPPLSDLSYPCQTSALRALLSMSDLRSPSSPIHVKPPLSDLSYPCQTSALSGTGSEDHLPMSISQCRKPDISNVDPLATFQDYYNANESAVVTYEPLIKYINDVSGSDLKEKDKGNTSVTFTNLQPFSKYRIHTTLHIKNSSFPLETMEIRTNESVPDCPIIQQIPSMKDNKIRWELSDTRGYVTGFQMDISARRDYNASFIVDESIWFLRNVTEYTIPLQHGTRYNVTLRGFTSVGAGKVTTLNIETEIGDPPCHVEKAMNHSTLQLIPVHDLHGPISFYEIIVFAGQEINMSASCPRFQNSHYNSRWTSSNYTAAVLPAQNLTESRTFILGDNQHYNGFHNAPLLPEHAYTIYIRVTSQWKQVNKSSCSFAGFLEVTSDEPASSSVQIIAGSLAAVILLLVLVMLVVKWKCWKSGKSSRSSDIPLKAKAGPGKKKDIPVDNLLGVVKRFRMMEIAATNDEEEDSAMLSVGRYQEYKELPGALMHLCSVGLSQENQAKNRYKKVLPYDDSRVVLRSSHSRSDYINASYIDGYKAPKFYIATQGPIPETVSDFWSMVWQENSSVIVMLTGLEEQNKVKCERYWPEQSQTYGDITVSVQQIVHTGAFTIRSFSLKKVQSVGQMMVEQIHYLRWPDHGVPKNTSDMVQLVELTNNCNSPRSGPIIVHCSAGIGRTGTFLALDILLKMASAVKKVNVYNCVLELRKKRVKMVQEKEQYVFLYDVLLETLLCGSTCVPVPEIHKHARCMSIEDPTTNKNGFHREFQTLEKITELYRIHPCKEWKKLENQTKNRHPDILPGDHWRPILLSALTRHGTPGYINAVFVNSNSQDDAMIVTQLPMKQTLADFWALVWDYKCTAVVMMQGAQDLQKNGSRFWPEKGETAYGAFKVRTTAKYPGNGYTASTLSLRKSNEPSDGSLEVTLLQMDSWPLDRPLPEDPATLISLVGEAEKCQLQMSGSRTLVTCCDGAGRSGLFCAGVIICDQIRSDGCLDVSQAVRSLRRRRCQFIPNVEQYSFCYTLAHSYLDSFETYGNFK
ncbi:receptor-type tyrosine-protein phosphatase T-like [Mantella aurantiaca]